MYRTLLVGVWLREIRTIPIYKSAYGSKWVFFSEENTHFDP